MGSHHDTGYKELFSYPELVQQLIEGFIPAEIASLMDFSTLKNHNGHYITPLFEEKIEDVVWSVKLQNGENRLEVYLYILLEFQSTDDPRMALRFMHYIANFYSQLIKQNEVKSADALPPVLPIVLYNGNVRWRAPLNMLELIHSVPDFLKPYQPKLHYYLVDEGAYSEEQLAQIDSPMSGVFTLENAKDKQQLIVAVERITRILKNRPDKQRLDAVITRWFKRHLQRMQLGIKLDQLNSLAEEQTMLAENLQNWLKSEVNAGRLEGKLEGYAQLISKQLKLRFPQSDVSDYGAVLSQATPERLESIAEQLLTAKTLEEALA